MDGSNSAPGLVAPTMLEAKARIPQPSLVFEFSSWIGYFRDTLATLQRATCFALVFLLFNRVLIRPSCRQHGFVWVIIIAPSSQEDWSEWFNGSLQREDSESLFAIA